MTWIDDELRRNPNPPELFLPARYGALTLKDLPPSDLTAKAKHYLQNFWELAARGKAPAFLGQAGRGKSETAAVIAKLVNRNPVGDLDTEWQSTPQLVQALDFDRYGARTKATLKRLEQVPFLVLDDIHVIKRGGLAHSVFEATISARFDGFRPTLITGNFDLPAGAEWDSLTDYFGPLLGRRLREGATGLTVLLDAS